MAQAGPHAATRTWVHAVLEGDHARAWNMLDPDYSEHCASLWAHECRDLLADDRLRETAARALCEARPGSELWPLCVGFLDTLRSHINAFAPREYFGWPAGTRLLAPDHEAVLLVDVREAGIGRAARPAVVRACTFVMRLVDEAWLVAGFKLPEQPQWLG